ncbi:MAG TPA: ABC transporter ATP-binding protein [Clostridiales bacterium]|nr:ABC transporter ATP-binding protein [Clostridiales bacterium]
MITLESVAKTAGGRQILNIALLHIDRGERVALIGPNGSGKSTLLRVIAGIVPPDAGCVIFEPPGTQAYLMPQVSFGFARSVLKNLEIGLPASMKSAEKRAAAEKTADMLALRPLLKKHGNKLSGGETQRLALGRLLTAPKSLLLLDEPTGSADFESTRLIEDVLLAACEKNGTTLLFATHDARQAERLAGRIILLENGRVAKDTPAAAFAETAGSGWGKRLTHEQHPQRPDGLPEI